MTSLTTAVKIPVVTMESVFLWRMTFNVFVTRATQARTVKMILTNAFRTQEYAKTEDNVLTNLDHFTASASLVIMGSSVVTQRTSVTATLVTMAESV